MATFTLQVKVIHFLFLFISHIFHDTESAYLSYLYNMCVAMQCQCRSWYYYINPTSL